MLLEMNKQSPLLMTKTDELVVMRAYTRPVRDLKCYNPDEQGHFNKDLE